MSNKDEGRQAWWNSLRHHHAGSYSRICDRCGSTFYAEDWLYHWDKRCTATQESEKENTDA